MKAFIVYAHPSSESFTRHVKDSFIDGLVSAGHTYLISDLYAMGFKTDMCESEYMRESTYRSGEAVPKDVKEEQEKINLCDTIVFIYPIFWTEAPAKLVGWIDRVRDKRMIVLDSMSKFDLAERQKNWEAHLKTAFEAGRTL